MLERAPEAGLLLQPTLHSHPDLQPVGGDFGLSTIRINTALTNSGPEILFIFAKLLGGQSLTDNFTEGRSGNMIAQVDAQTGVFDASGHVLKTETQKLPTIQIGTKHDAEFILRKADTTGADRVKIEVLRPTGFTAAEHTKDLRPTAVVN
jgi:hypothetical protein